ncbi:MAG: hypothetical protein O7E49_01170 [Gemmatimonadetes bacterium]|nr:hypothetical protein [Gemmatimonadota bacterium]
MIRASLAAVLLAIPFATQAQGLPFHTESALTTAFEERGLRAFTMVGRRGDATTVTTPLVILPWAPHHRVTTRVVVPLVHKRFETTGSSYSQTGLGDVALAIKWAFHVRDRPSGTTRLAVVASGTLPTGSTGATFENGMLAPPQRQLGKGTATLGAALAGTIIRGRWGLNFDVGHARNGTHDGFQFGATTRYDVAIGFRIPDRVETIRTRTVQLYLEWNGVITGRSEQGSIPVPNSGGHVAFLSPGVQWVVMPQLLLEGSIQIPVLQTYNGSQPSVGVRPALGARFLFF